MENELWAQLANVLVTMIKNLKKINPTDISIYSLYLALIAFGAIYKIKELNLKITLPCIFTLLSCQIAYALMLDEKESNYYVILTMFYAHAIFYYSKVNLKTAVSCAIMAAYLFIMSREAKYYEVHGTSFSDVLHDSYWMVILLLHCIICCSFFSRLQYKRAYLGLCKLICGSKVS